MSADFRPHLIENNLALKAFLAMREGGKIPLKYSIPLAVKALLTDIPFAMLNMWPGSVGMKLRQIYYSFKMASLGKNVLFGVGTEVVAPENIFVSDHVLIDHHVTLHALGGKIVVGRRIHIAPYATIAGNGGVALGDYASVGAFARVYSHTEALVDGKRLSGPMIPEYMKGMLTAEVVVGKDALVCTGAVVLPGCTIGEGAVIGANSLVPARTIIPPYTIYAGVPAKLMGLRQKVNVQDL